MSSYSLIQKRSRLRRELRQGQELDLEDLRFLPSVEQQWVLEGTWAERYVPQRPVWKYHGHDLRLRPVMARIKAEFRPLVQAFRGQIRRAPDLADRRTMAAAYVELIKVARTPHQVLRALEGLRRIYGHDRSSKRVRMTTSESPEDVAAELRRLVEALPLGS